MNRKPNIIYIYADDLGRGMLSCYGQKYFSTPNIDRVAGEGIRFTNSYGCAFCAPARASLLTGLHDCHRDGWTYTSGGIYDKLTTGEIELDELSELINTTGLQAREDEVFLAELAKQAGYVTAEIGKLEWGFATTNERMKRHGWDYHYGYYDHAQCHGFYPPYLFENGKKVAIPGNTRSDFGKTGRIESPENKEERWDLTGKAMYSQDLFDQKILQFIHEHKDRPFFLFHPSQLPHGPISIPEIHPSVKNIPTLTDFEKEYASMVLRLDHTVGLVLNELEVLGLDDNTMVVFCSDNGHEPYYRETNRCEPGKNMVTGQEYDNVITKFYSNLSGDIFDGNNGMAGKKFSNWEGGIRIPYAIRWPGAIKAGCVSDHFFANYDFFPTMAEIIGVPMPAGKDGISFYPELRGENQDEHPFLVFASGVGPSLITKDGYKLRHLRLTGKNLYQLYYLPEDYREEKDLVWDARDIVNKLSTEMLRVCSGNYIYGTHEPQRVYLPGLHFYGPECHWDMLTRNC